MRGASSGEPKTSTSSWTPSPRISTVWQLKPCDWAEAFAERRRGPRGLCVRLLTCGSPCHEAGRGADAGSRGSRGSRKRSTRGSLKRPGVDGSADDPDGPDCGEPVSQFAAGCAICGADLERHRREAAARRRSMPRVVVRGAAVRPAEAGPVAVGLVAAQAARHRRVHEPSGDCEQDDAGADEDATAEVSGFVRRHARALWREKYWGSA